MQIRIRCPIASCALSGEWCGCWLFAQVREAFMVGGGSGCGYSALKLEPAPTRIHQPEFGRRGIWRWGPTVVLGRM